MDWPNLSNGGTLTGALNEAPAVVLASAGTVNIGAAAANSISITGTTTITAFDSIADGAVRSVTFSGALTLTHNGTSLILPGSANITTAAGDTASFVSLGSGNWRCTGYMPAIGGPVGVDKARAYRAAALTTGAATFVKVTVDTTSYDTNSIVDLTNSRITPKKPGYYKVDARASFTTTASGQRGFSMIYKNGAEVSRGADVTSYASGSGSGAGASDVIYMNGTTDYVEVWIYTSTAQSLEAGSPVSFLSVYGPL